MTNLAKKEIYATKLSKPCQAALIDAINESPEMLEAIKKASTFVDFNIDFGLGNGPELIRVPGQWDKVCGNVKIKVVTPEKETSEESEPAKSPKAGISEEEEIAREDGAKESNSKSIVKNALIRWTVVAVVGVIMALLIGSATGLFKRYAFVNQNRAGIENSYNRGFFDYDLDGQPDAYVEDNFQNSNMQKYWDAQAQYENFRNGNYK